MEVNKICEFCNEHFIAQKTTTRYCSDVCSKRAYKKRIKEEKISIAEKKYLSKLKGFDIVEIQKKDYLSIREAMFLLNISRMTIHRMLKDGRLKKLEGLKSVRIRKTDIDGLFNSNNSEKKIHEDSYKLPYFSTDNYYTINQIIEKFNVTGSSFDAICKRNKIPKIKKGKFVFVPKELVDKVFKI